MFANGTVKNMKKESYTSQRGQYFTVANDYKNVYSNVVFRPKRKLNLKD